MPRIPAERRRELLVQAALRVLSRDGLAATTTRAVVAEAGMPLASFHYAFRSRDELLRELIGHVVAGEGDATLLPLLDQGGDIRGMVRASFEAYFRVLRDDPGREQAMFELTQHALRTPGLDDLPRQQYGRYHELARELLRIAARRTGVAWNVPDDELAWIVVAFSDGITLAWLATRDDDAASRALDLAAEAVALHARQEVRS